MSKSRLASTLSARARARLIEDMLEASFNAARGAAGYSDIILVSPIQCDVPSDVSLILDNDEGMNAAFALACEYAISRGHAAAALIPADLPLLEPVDLEVLLRMAAQTSAAIAGDRKKAGTNALLLPLPLPIALAFEGNSFSRHLMLCRAVGLIPAIVERPGLAFDVDEVRDVISLEKMANFTFLADARAF